jgi:heme o synthase
VLSKSESTVSSPATYAPNKLADYVAFVKLRLSLLVVFSAVIGFVIILKEGTDWIRALWLTIAGFLVTGSANGFNQIIERRFDKLMHRTHMRPLPQERMTVREGIFLASLLGMLGLLILYLFLNPLSSILSALSILLYVACYTPLKRKSAFSVLVGAFPGAFPPLLGAIAATKNFGSIPFEGVVLFAIQFIWQFPHFWAIAWVMNEDYNKAGFYLLPSGERNKASAFQIVFYTLFLLLISMVPVFFGMTHTVFAPIIILAAGIIFLVPAIKLYRNCSIQSAQQVMFGSFAYLPIVQLTILLG